MRDGALDAGEKKRARASANGCGGTVRVARGRLRRPDSRLVLVKGIECGPAHTSTQQLAQRISTSPRPTLREGSRNPEAAVRSQAQWVFPGRRGDVPRTRPRQNAALENHVLGLVLDGSKLNREQRTLSGYKTTFVWLCSHNVVKGIYRHAEGVREYISPIRTLRRLFPKIHEDFLK